MLKQFIMLLPVDMPICFRMLNLHLTGVLQQQIKYRLIRTSVIDDTVKETYSMKGSCD